MARRRIRYLTTEQAAAHVGLSPRTLERYRVRGGGPPFLSYCNRVHYLRSDLDDWAVRRRRRSTSDKAGAAGMRGTREEKGESTDGNRLSVNEAAAFLGASRRTLDRYRAKGVGPAFEKVDGRVYYLRSGVEAWLAKQNRLSTSDPGDVDEEAEDDTDPCRPEDAG